MSNTIKILYSIDKKDAELTANIMVGLFNRHTRSDVKISITTIHPNDLISKLQSYPNYDLVLMHDPEEGEYELIERYRNICDTIYVLESSMPAIVKAMVLDMGWDDYRNQNDCADDIEEMLIDLKLIPKKSDIE